MFGDLGAVSKNNERAAPISTLSPVRFAV